MAEQHPDHGAQPSGAQPSAAQRSATGSATDRSGAGVAGARRRADEAGVRIEKGRRRLRELSDEQSPVAPGENAAGGRTARSPDWSTHAQDQAARMHDSAAALHDQAAVLGIGDEQEHRRRAENHRAAARSNRPRTGSDQG